MMLPLRIPRRLKLYRNFLLWILLISLLPITLLLSFSYYRSIANARDSLEDTVDRAYRQIT